MAKKTMHTRVARATAVSALLLGSTVAIPLAVAGEASAATVRGDSGCHASPLYNRADGVAGEIGGGVGPQHVVGAKGYCSGTRPYRIQIYCNRIVNGPTVRSGYSTAYCPKGQYASAAYIYRTG